MLECQEGEPQAGQHVFISPQTNRAVGSFTGQETGPPDAQPMTIGCTHPASGAPEEATCQPFEPGALISNSQERTTRRAQVSTGHVRCTPVTCAERYANAWGHRTHTTGCAPEHPVPFLESTTNALGHRTQTTRRALSVRCSQSKTSADVRQHRTHEHELPCVRCSASGA